MEMAGASAVLVHARARNPARSVTLGGGGKPVLTPVGGSPFCSDFERGRREGTIADYLDPAR